MTPCLNWVQVSPHHKCSLPFPCSLSCDTHCFFLLYLSTSMTMCSLLVFHCSLGSKPRVQIYQMSFFMFDESMVYLCALWTPRNPWSNTNVQRFVCWVYICVLQNILLITIKPPCRRVGMRCRKYNVVVTPQLGRQASQGAFSSDSSNQLVPCLHSEKKRFLVTSINHRSPGGVGS